MCIHVIITVRLPVKIISGNILTQLMTGLINVQPLYSPEQMFFLFYSSKHTHTHTYIQMHNLPLLSKGHNISCDYQHNFMVVGLHRESWLLQGVYII